MLRHFAQKRIERRICARRSLLTRESSLLIFLTVLSINYIGDGLRDALDPRKTQ